MAFNITVQRNENETPPEHHVIAKSILPWPSVLSSWSTRSGGPSNGNGQAKVNNASASEPARFRNPWPSFHKATRQEMWDSLAFGTDEDPCISLAASHVPGTTSTDSSRATRDQQAAYLLKIEKPDFSFNGDTVRSKSTWLGHASMLLQLPGFCKNASPLRILFDPIFSMRCSPSQSVGPIRSYVPPCKVEELPPIDIVLISHNHYDHLDYDTIRKLWKLHESRIRFIVPLNNRRWFTECGISAERIEELDWWESVTIAEPASKDDQLRITCTPAQHSSGRDGFDADETLWSSWYLERSTSKSKPYRIFFAGDSGYQFHGSPTWPPQPPRQSSLVTDKPSAASSSSERPNPKRLLGDNDINRPVEEYPPCPAFKEIANRLGSPHLIYLPLALGATWAYFKSFFSSVLPDSLDPFPRHSSGVTGAIHMPPWDAVRVLQEMTERLSSEPESEEPVAIGMHWGTFVTDQTEVLKTLGQLEWACDQQKVRFSRSMSSQPDQQSNLPLFLALNHGQSIST